MLFLLSAPRSARRRRSNHYKVIPTPSRLPDRIGGTASSVPQNLIFRNFCQCRQTFTNKHLKAALRFILAFPSARVEFRCNILQHGRCVSPETLRRSGSSHNALAPPIHSTAHKRSGRPHGNARLHRPDRLHSQYNICLPVSAFLVT